MVSRKVLSSLTRLSLSKNLKIWVLEKSKIELIKDIANQLVTPSPEKVQILKEFSRRLVFRIQNNEHEKSLIIKSFPLKGFKEVKKYRRYGLLEFDNYQNATSYSIPTPNYYAYFENRRFGFVNLNGIIMEDLCNYVDLYHLADQHTTNKEQILGKAIPIIVSCFHKGINHIDLTPQNMLVNKDKIKVLDWQYCNFVKPRQEAQLLLQTAHFFRFSDLNLTDNVAQQWLEKIYRESESSLTQANFVDSITKLNSFDKINIIDRLSLNIKKYL